MTEAVKLTRPVKNDGKDIKEVVLDLDGLTGADMAEAEREYLVTGGIPTNLNSSISYLQHVASRACGIEVDVIGRMSAKDSMYLTTRTQVFLLDMELPSASKPSGSSASN
jgi:hypothetical protein